MVTQAATVRGGTELHGQDSFHYTDECVSIDKVLSLKAGLWGRFNRHFLMTL